MYAPRHFREERPDVLAAAIRDVGFASLVAVDGGGAIASVHLPLLLSGEAGPWVLEGHVALANPIWRVAEAGGAALAVFQGPHAYIHPGWYPSKQVDGRAVPTWNYVVVEARGTLSIERDPDWLRTHVAALTDTHEAAQADRWSLGDAPSDYVERLLKGIVGVRLTVDGMEGVWKMAQHHPDANRMGVASGLAASENPNAHAVAAIMRPS